MTSREIIIDLIDRQIIDGEKAFILINDLLQSEMMEAWKVLDDSKKASKKNNLDWLQVQPFSGPYTTTGLTWTGGSNTMTCDAINSAASTLSVSDLTAASV